MKRIKVMIICSLILVLFTFGGINVSAMNTGFSTETLTEDQKEIFLKNVNISILDKEPQKNTIECFDVNSNQLIAIGQKTSERKTICIYSKEGIFQYGYTFNCTGSFGVEWDEENLNIYFVRSDVIVSLDSNGKILDIKEVQDTISNNTHRNDLLYSTSRIVGDDEYCVGNNMGILNLFATSYSQVIVKGVDDTESIIYDVGTTQLNTMISTIVIIAAFVAVVIIGVVFEFIKLRR